MKKRIVVFCYLLPAMISLLLIGAHFLRSGNILIPILSLLLVMALCIREPLIARTVQLALLLATAEWSHVTFTLVSARLAAGLPWTKLAIILGSVTALAMAAIALFLTKALKEMYHLSFNPGNHERSRIAEHDCAMTGSSSPPDQAAATERRQQLLAVHYLKGGLTTCSLAAFLLMDYSIGLGLITLIAIGLINTALRRRMRGIGGILPSADKRKLYLWQALGLCVFALPIIGYYAFSLPIMEHRLIVDSTIAAFTTLLLTAARYEYLPKGQES